MNREFAQLLQCYIVTKVAKPLSAERPLLLCAVSAAGSTGQSRMTGMTDAADCLRVAANYLAGARFCPSEADEAREIAAMVMADLPADLATRVECALDCDDYRAAAWALDGIANILDPPAAPTPQAKPRRPRRPRKATLASALKQAAKANVPVSAAVIGADGVTLHFGKGESTEASNPWLDDLKVTKQ
jgi:hypothetical protein